MANFTVIENATLSTMATVKKMDLFELREYITANVVEPVEPVAIRKFGDCIKFIEDNGLTVKAHGNGTTGAEDKTANRDYTLARINALTTSPNVEGLEIKATHNGGRLAVKGNGYTLFTLFVQTKHCNLAMREKTLARYTEVFGTTFENVGTLSYGSQSTFVKELSYDTVTKIPVLDEEGNKVLTEDGLPMYNTTVTEGALYNVVVNLLTLYGVYIPEEPEDAKVEPKEVNKKAEETSKKSKKSKAEGVKVEAEG